MSQLKLFLLGVPQVELNQQPVPLQRRKMTALLVYLAVTRQKQQRDMLATLFWPDLGQTSARAALRREVHLLNTTIGDNWLLTTRNEIALTTDGDLWIDVELFRHNLDTVARHHHAPNTLCGDCLQRYTEAAALYRGDFLSEFTLVDCPEFEEWRSFQADSLRHRFANLVQTLVATHQQRGNYTLAINHARRWLAIEPTAEPIHRTLMHLHALAGHYAAAQRQYEECVRILDEELGVAPTEETVTLYESVRTRRISGRETKEPKNVTTGVSSQTADDSPIDNNLPPQTTSFVGRQAEVDKVCDLLSAREDCRLLTLIGPGGMGKTRLALQVARTIVDDDNRPWRDGLYFVPLAAVNDEAGLVRAIASAIDYSFRGTDEPQTQLEAYLRPQQLLLVTDNFEHLLDGASLLSALFTSAPELSILATSREALNVPEEWLYPLGGLAVPSGQEPLDVLAANSAVQLFVERAQRVARRFALTDQTAQAVARVCQLVDGMPLALELSAAWINTLTVDEIVEEIAADIDILTSEMRNIPERHRSMRAIFQQTWRRLTAQEQQTLRRLAVFRGAFSRQAANQVTAAALFDLSSLVNKSLCRHQAGRYDIHELLRQFAFEQMDVAEQQLMLRQHSSYFGELLASQQQHLMTAAEERMLQTITEEFDNVLAAWHFLVTMLQGNNVATQPMTLLTQTAPVLSAYFDRRGLFYEGQRTLALAMDALRQSFGSELSISIAFTGQLDESLENVLLQLQLEHVTIGMNLGQYAATKTALLPWLPHLQGEELRVQRARVLTCVGRAELRMGNYNATAEYLEEALDLYGQTDLQLESTTALIHMGMLQRRREQYAEARAYYQQAIDIYKTVSYGAGIARCLSNMGSTYTQTSEMPAAIALYQQAHEIATANNNRRWMGITLSNLGSCFQTLGDYPASRTHYEESLQLFRELDEKRWIMVSLAELSFTLIALSDLDEAQLILSESLTLGQAHHLVADTLLALAAVVQWLQQKEQYAQAVAVAAHLLDNPRTRSDARERTQSVLQHLVGAMPPVDYQAAQFHGRSTPYEQLVNDAIQTLCN